jgi:hypothetical protein
MPTVKRMGALMHEVLAGPLPRWPPPQAAELEQLGQRLGWSAAPEPDPDRDPFLMVWAGHLSWARGAAPGPRRTMTSIPCSAASTTKSSRLIARWVRHFPFGNL